MRVCQTDLSGQRRRRRRGRLRLPHRPLCSHPPFPHHDVPARHLPHVRRESSALRDAGAARASPGLPPSLAPSAGPIGAEPQHTPSPSSRAPLPHLSCPPWLRSVSRVPLRRCNSRWMKKRARRGRRSLVSGTCNHVVSRPSIRRHSRAALCTRRPSPSDHSSAVQPARCGLLSARLSRRRGVLEGFQKTGDRTRHTRPRPVCVATARSGDREARAARDREAGLFLVGPETQGYGGTSLWSTAIRAGAGEISTPA